MKGGVVRLAAGLVTAVVVGSCAAPSLTVNVKAPAGTNQGRPLYMLVRTVSKTTMTEGYADVAAKVISPDDSVLQTVVIYPSRTKQVKIPLPPEQAVAVSFLFTTPNGAWQALLDVPVPRSVDIELQESRIRTDLPQHMSAQEAAPAVPEAPKAPKAPEPPTFASPK
ncbi:MULTISPECIES: type VI secretion lipoprotein TssJ [Corallococcus]|uniref:type VI secretion lipoprotein TssJ n=1 Tax=Corallococcus TaxID=83461 RepID=UPI00117F5C6C|nr:MULTISPECIES: type VI secretion lipoprotein TssJ [Corallococcus]NBD11119.1 hypothetical protein [Corallococcus silvisoli]TSC26677.1 type VI secretion lipoprotein TssJ [Corallococcus sp. Z5C101001]